MAAIIEAMGLDPGQRITAGQAAHVLQNMVVHVQAAFEGQRVAIVCLNGELRTKVNDTLVHHSGVADQAKLDYDHAVASLHEAT